MGSNSKTAFQLGIESLGTIVHPWKHTETTDLNLANECSFLGRFKNALEYSAALLGDSASSELTALVDEAKYSDPVSNEECSAIEAALEGLASEIASGAENGACNDELIIKARKSLAARNQTCLFGK